MTKAEQLIDSYLLEALKKGSQVAYAGPKTGDLVPGTKGKVVDMSKDHATVQFDDFKQKSYLKKSMLKLA